MDIDLKSKMNSNIKWVCIYSIWTRARAHTQETQNQHRNHTHDDFVRIRNWVRNEVYIYIYIYMVFWFIPVKILQYSPLFVLFLFVCLLACFFLFISRAKKREETSSCCRCSCSIWSIVRSRSFDGLTKSVYIHIQMIRMCSSENNLILSFTFTFTHIVFHSLLIFISFQFIYSFSVLVFGWNWSFFMVKFWVVFRSRSKRIDAGSNEWSNTEKNRNVSVAHISLF